MDIEPINLEAVPADISFEAGTASSGNPYAIGGLTTRYAFVVDVTRSRVERRAVRQQERVRCPVVCPVTKYRTAIDI